MLGSVSIILIAFVLFNLLKNPQEVPLSALTSNQLHGHKIFADHNRQPQVGSTCNCNAEGSYGFVSKPNSDKTGSNNWLPCKCRKNEEINEPCPDASKGSCYNYNRKMRLIGNPNAEHYGEKIGHLKMINKLNLPRNCKSVVGFVPNPRCDSCHPAVSSKRESPWKFYDF